jgi:hypothetical protein
MPTQPMSQLDTKQPEISQGGMLLTPEQHLRLADAFQQKHPGLAALHRLLARRRLQRRAHGRAPDWKEKAGMPDSWEGRPVGEP